MHANTLKRQCGSVFAFLNLTDSTSRYKLGSKRAHIEDVIMHDATDLVNRHIWHVLLGQLGSTDIDRSLHIHVPL